ncbi:MAG: cysteinyl-tRNA synthetase [Rhodospirillaceae bacterium]|nr:MAG: cysteinyl-tRNA synthetase [Rhodospirillaceae bacterium]
MTMRRESGEVRVHDAWIAMPLALYNTLTRRKESFVPIDPADVRMYVCGPTVYDRAHIGNARPVVVFDVLYRLLKRLYPRVVYVRNITDVDDKITARAAAGGRSIDAITGETIRFFHEDVETLNALSPDVEPRATLHIAEMIRMIERLMEQGHAYGAAGHVLFSVASAPDYGVLSGRSREEMIAGARVEVAPYKQDPADFVLWKPSPPDLPGWDSPWGRGRPGWHIECSAMAHLYLGNSFDIHGGGQDLIFPHHENERAQSVCTHGGPFVRYWLHNGWLMVEGEKMSKSLGNVITVRQLLEQGVAGETIRLVLLATHYHQPLDWTEAGVRQAKGTLDRFYTALRAVADVPAQAVEATEVMGALCDDLNTPRALAALHETATALNKAVHRNDKARLKGELLDGTAVLGLLAQTPEAWFRGGTDSTAIEILIARRTAAREGRDFAEADRIRDALRQKGIILEDSATGTLWRRT